MLATVRRPSRTSGSVQPVGAEDPWGELMAVAQLGNAGAYTRAADRKSTAGYGRLLCSPSAGFDGRGMPRQEHASHPPRPPTTPTSPVVPSRHGLAGIARYKWIDRLRALDRDLAVSGAEDISEDIPIDDHGPCDRERGPAFASF